MEAASPPEYPAAHFALPRLQLSSNCTSPIYSGIIPEPVWNGFFKVRFIGLVSVPLMQEMEIKHLKSTQKSAKV